MDAAHAAAGGTLCRPYRDMNCCVDCGVEMATCAVCGSVGYHRAGCWIMAEEEVGS